MTNWRRHFGPCARVLAPLVAASLVGCATGPDYRPPAPPGGTQLTSQPLPELLAGLDPGNAPQRFIDAAAVPPAWWTVFGSRTLDALVERAIQHNPTLVAAEAALRQANELLAAQRAAFLPSLQASYAPQRGRVAQAVSSPLASGALLYTLHTAQLSVGYVPDAFGANRRGVEALAAQRDAQAWQLRAARLSLAANVVNAAVQDASLRAQLQAIERLREIAAHELQLAKVQRRLGDAPGAAVFTQEAVLHQAEATAAGLRKQLAQQDDLLAVLAGDRPTEAMPITIELAGLQLPDIPTSLPAALVAHRPDVRAAEAQLHAANAQVGVAAAALLPQISLSADFGSAAQRLSEMFRANGLLWSVGAEVAQTVFDGGALRHRRRAAEAALDEALAQYESTLLVAFQNISDGLEAARHDAELQQATTQEETAAARALAIARRQLELGDIGRLALLQSESAWLQAKIADVQARADRLSDVAALYQALGGSWNSESGADPASARARGAPVMSPANEMASDAPAAG
jgi:NodT family efflux transporter outer membrane factor (OMF) lipoprotein